MDQDKPTPRDRVKALINDVAAGFHREIMLADEKYGTLGLLTDTAAVLQNLDLSDDDAVRRAIADLERQGIEHDFNPFDADSSAKSAAARARKIAVGMLNNVLPPPPQDDDPDAA